MLPRAWLCAVLTGLLALAAPIGSTEAASAALTTFGYGNARLGTSPGSAGIAAHAVPRLRIAWRARLDGAITGQPLIVDHVRAGRRFEDLAIVGTGHGVVAALDARSGSVLWRHRVGSRTIAPDCEASPDGRFGVTGTPVIDSRARKVYVVDVSDRAWAFDLASGRVAHGWPVRISANRADFVWGALALSGQRLYVPVASLCDGGHYGGGIVAVDVRHPHHMLRWRTTAGTGAYAGGIWGWGGVSVDAGGDVYAATGNSLGTAGEDSGFAESVVRLSPALSVRQANDPLRPPFSVSDRDFGTTPVLLGARGCPAQLVAINKDGELFLYDRNRISAGPVQRLTVAADQPGGIPLYGIPAFDPATRTLVLVSPTTPPHSVLRAGIQAFVLTKSCRLAVRWLQRFDWPDAGSAPTIAAGVVYIAGGRNGWMHAYRLGDGRPLWARHLSSAAILAVPAVDRGTLFVADWRGVVRALRPPRS